ncbi:MAG: hypothetical protein IJC99_04140 [Clostridia bacterium]|nr:hypothetical protein [Clostridia bacterium]
MKKRVIDAEAWLRQVSNSWMNYNLAVKIIREAPVYEVEEELLGLSSDDKREVVRAVTAEAKQVKCRACGRAIKWVKMPSGKNMPCDLPEIHYLRDENGSESFVTEQGAIVRGARVEQGGEVGYISHFMTCPKADTFRRERK